MRMHMHMHMHMHMCMQVNLSSTKQLVSFRVQSSEFILVKTRQTDQESPLRAAPGEQQQLVSSHTTSLVDSSRGRSGVGWQIVLLGLRVRRCEGGSNREREAYFFVSYVRDFELATADSAQPASF